MADTDVQIKFDAPAVLRKWPSRDNERINNSWPYLVAEGTLDECIRQFMSKPASTHHLYEIHTTPQGELITAVLSPEQIIAGFSLVATVIAAVESRAFQSAVATAT